MEKEITMPVGVVVERKKIDHIWADWTWKPVAVLCDPPEIPAWHVMKSEGAITHFHAATVGLNFHRKLVEAYKVNLAGEAPLLWVILQEVDYSESSSDEWPYKVHLVTASPYDAQDLLDSGDEIVEAVAMPEAIVSRLVAFVKAHPEEVPFKKRKRDRLDLEELKFSKQPIFARVDRNLD